MNLETACRVLDVLETMQDAVKQMKQSYILGSLSEFHMLAADMKSGLSALIDLADRDEERGSVARLRDGCSCALLSLEDLMALASRKPEEVPWKLECELLAFVEGIYLKLFYDKILQEDPARKDELRERIARTNAYYKIFQPEEEREYTCDLSIFMPAYNHLDYSKLCVTSILNNLPEGVTCELVLLNNGCSDGTREYFESIPGAHVINMSINRIFPLTGMRALGGKYSLFVSNDIIIGKNAISNMYRAISEHKDYGWIVPATSAVSNLQILPVQYQSVEEFHAFAARNNHYDENRHEMRVRLCNPVTMIPTDLYNQLQLDLYEEMYCIQNISAFPDDKISLWMRRHGYKSILEKDAYCHHFGSVTHRDDYDSEKKWNEFYAQGRREFLRNFGVDPWGTGFCYDKIFMDRVVDEESGHVEVLGINCGLGSNSLKVKEQLREYGCGAEPFLMNITDDSHFLADLRGISDSAEAVASMKDFKSALHQHRFRYIVWETPFLKKHKFRKLLDICLQHLDAEGKFIIKQTEQFGKSVESCFPVRRGLSDGWILIRRADMV